MAFDALTTAETDADSPLDTTLMTKIKDNFDDLDLRVTAFYVGSFTRDTSVASGNQAITGVGFLPRAILFIGGQGGTSEFSWGVDDGTTALAAVDQNPLVTDTYGNALFSIEAFQGAGQQYQGKINSFDSDGFTVAWTKTGTPTGTVTMNYIAFK